MARVISYLLLLLSIVHGMHSKNIDHRTILRVAEVMSEIANINRKIASDINLNRAVIYHRVALMIKKRYLANTAIEIAHNLADLGATYNELKGEEHNKRAIGYYKQALTRYEHIEHDGRYIASTLHKLGNAYRDLSEDNIDIAINYLNKSLELYNSLPEDEFVLREKGKTFYNQAVNYHHLDNDDSLRKALYFLNESALLFDRINDQPRRALTLSYIGEVNRSLGNNPIAIDYLLQALAIQKNLYSYEHKHIATTLFYLGTVYLELKDQSARDYLNAALTIQRKQLRENHPDIARTLYYLGLSYIEINNVDHGIKLINQAITLFQLLPPSHYYIKVARKSFNPLIESLHSQKTVEAQSLLHQIQAL